MLRNAVLDPFKMARITFQTKKGPVAFKAASGKAALKKKRTRVMKAVAAVASDVVKPLTSAVKNANAVKEPSMAMSTRAKTKMAAITAAAAKRVPKRPRRARQFSYPTQARADKLSTAA